MRYEMRPTRHGRMLFDADDTFVGRALMELGEYSWEEVELLESLVRPDGWVLEAGAHIGTITQPLARRVNTVFAFEPQRLVFQMLCANLAMNGIANVRAFEQAVGPADGHCVVPFPKGGNTGGVSLRGVTEGDLAVCRSVDSLELPRLDLLKADVEDMELDVLRGARETLKRCRPLLYLESNREHDALLDEVERNGYAAWWHFPKMLLEKRAGKTMLVCSFNWLCVPQEVMLERTRELMPVLPGDEAPLKVEEQRLRDLARAA